MDRIAFLGMGQMGRRMAARLVAAGHEVNVWSRSAQVVPAGAQAAKTLAKACADAQIVISMLRDDAASAEVWLGPNGAAAAMPDGALAVECSTISTAQARVLVQGVARLVHAPVAGSLPQAEAGKLVFLAGGTSERIDALAPVLERMGAAVLRPGGPEQAAALKLVINVAFAAQVAAVSELAGLARDHGIAPDALAALLQNVPVFSPTALGALAAICEAQFAPAFPIDLVAKDMALAVRSAQGPAPLTGFLQDLFAGAADRGLGALNITGLARDYGF